MLWDVDATRKRPFETRFRLFRLSGATEETLCSQTRMVAWVRDGHALDKGIGKYSGKGLLYVSYPQNSGLFCLSPAVSVAGVPFDPYKSN